MRVLLTEWFRGWKGSEPQDPRPQVLDLTDEKHLFFLVVSLGNGNFDEARFECESKEAEAFVVETLTGTGGAQKIEASDDIQRRTLFKPGCDVYLQSGDSCFFVSINPELDYSLPPIPNPPPPAGPAPLVNAKKRRWWWPWK